jgi:hypothetical protein
MGQLLALKTLVRAGVVAAALGAAAFAALPAQAAPPHFYGHMHGHFGYPGWPGYFGHGPYWYGGHWGYYPQPVPRAVCMTDWQVRNSLASRGYYSISLFSQRGLFVGAQARRGAWLYSLQVNRCNGAVVSVRRLRHI